MRHKYENAFAGDHPAKASRHTQHQDSATLGTSPDEVNETLIRQLGESMVAAISAGNRADALRLQAAMFAAIKARSPQEIQRRETAIDRAIASSRSTFLCAMATKRAA